MDSPIEIKIGQLWVDRNHRWTPGLPFDVFFLVTSGTAAKFWHLDNKLELPPGADPDARVWRLLKFFQLTGGEWKGTGADETFSDFNDDEIREMLLVGTLSDLLASEQRISDLKDAGHRLVSALGGLHYYTQRPEKVAGAREGLLQESARALGYAREAGIE